MKPKFRSVLEVAIEDGVRMGWNRAHKHNPEPTIESATDSIVNEIMNSLDSWFDFEDDYVSD